MSQDKLPSAVMKSIATTPLGRQIPEPGSSRFLRTVDGRHYYYVDGADSRACLVSAQSSDGTVAATCNYARELTGIGIYLAESDSAGRAPRVSLLVSDAFDHAADATHTLPVESNVVVFDELTGNQIVLTGQGGREHRIDVGELVPRAVR